jgi:hypothetical protein
MKRMAQYTYYNCAVLGIQVMFELIVTAALTINAKAQHPADIIAIHASVLASMNTR